MSKYLARVKRGEQLLMLERQGRITMPDKPGGIPDEFWIMPRPKDPDGLILKQLLEDREEGR